MAFLVGFRPCGRVNIPFLDAEALIRLKRDSWREKDRIDVAALKRILGR